MNGIACIAYIQALQCTLNSWLSFYRKLRYPQRKRASNMALLYGAKGFSIYETRMDHECDSTLWCHLSTPSYKP